MKPQDALIRVIEHREIFHEEMVSLMRQMMSGELSPALIAAIIVGLRVKKETIGEIAAAAQVMREFATRVEVPDHAHLLDTCGTGGDSAHTFNISTAAAFVAAAAGAKVAKHGNRSVSSKSGSADVLEALGVNIDLTPEQVGALHQRGRRRLHVRPPSPPRHEARGAGAARAGRAHDLQHPRAADQPRWRAGNQLMGVFHPDLVGIQARVLQRLGSRHVMVVYGVEGLDEISIAGETMVGELKDGEVREYVDPSAPVRPAQRRSVRHPGVRGRASRATCCWRRWKGAPGRPATSWR